MPPGALRARAVSLDRRGCVVRRHAGPAGASATKCWITRRSRIQWRLMSSTIIRSPGVISDDAGLGTAVCQGATFRGVSAATHSHAAAALSMACSPAFRVGSSTGAKRGEWLPGSVLRAPSACALA